MYFNRARIIGRSNAFTDFLIESVAGNQPYILKGITGLDPSDVDILLSPTLYEGNVYQGRRPRGRQVVMTVRLNPNYATGQTASQLREALYQYIIPGGQNDVDAFCLTTNSTVVTQNDAYISKMEANPWSKDPEIIITLELPSPFLKAPAATAVDLPSLSKSTPTFVNPGTAPSPMHMELTFTASTAAFTLFRGSYKMQITYAFLANDKLVIDSTPGAKVIQVVRGGVTTNILSGLSTDSVWFDILGGTSSFTTNVQTFNWTAVSFVPYYWGV